MPPPLIRRTVDVTLGSPQELADRIEAVFDAQKVAVVCHVKEPLVKVEISTLDLADKNLEQNIDAWIAEAATDLAAQIRLLDED
jgi:hypothetical protein